MRGSANSQAPDVDLGSVSASDNVQLGRRVLGRATACAQRIVRLVDVAQTEV